ASMSRLLAADLRFLLLRLALPRPHPPEPLRPCAGPHGSRRRAEPFRYPDHPWQTMKPQKGTPCAEAGRARIADSAQGVPLLSDTTAMSDQPSWHTPMQSGSPQMQTSSSGSLAMDPPLVADPLLAVRG